MAAYRQWRSNFPRIERKPKYGKKTDSYVFSGFVYGISRGWEQKSTTGRFVTGRFWPCTSKISSVGEDQVNNGEFCTLKITPIVCFCSVSLIFSSWVLAPMPCTIFIRGLSILYFHSSIKLTFLVSKGILCLYDKRNNTWLLVELSFLEFNSASHLWAIELNTLRKIPYPHSPMYSLFICFLSLFFLIETFFIHLSPECLLTEMWRVGGWKSNYSWFMR